MGEHELSLTLCLPTRLGQAALRRLLGEAHGIGVRRLCLTAKGGPLPVDAVAATAAEATDAGIDVEVALTGGEPGDTVAVLAPLARRPGACLREIAVPLDGGDAATHDAVHGAGAFARATALLLLAAGHGVATAVESTVLAPNLGGIEAIVRTAARCRARQVRVLAPMPTRVLLDAGSMPTPADLAAATREADEAAGVYDIELLLDLSFAAPTPYVVCPPLQCTALAVGEAGEALFCPRLPGVGLGTGSSDLAELLARHVAHANELLTWRAGLVGFRDALEPCSLHPCALCAARHGLLGGGIAGPWAGLLRDAAR
jgi:hypothetical protein